MNSLQNKIEDTIEKNISKFLKTLSNNYEENYLSLYAKFKISLDFNETVKEVDGILKVFDEDGIAYANIINWKPSML